MSNLSISPLQPRDWPQVWAIAEPVFRAGTTYAFDPAITEAEAHRVWVEVPQATYVARDEAGPILGTYYIKPNQPALGSHVCNCGYLVASAARGRGVATLMCEHSQQEARRLGFRAMQFNLVVSTNAIAVRLWHKLGFKTTGTLPGAFKHAEQGFVDAFVMYKPLSP
ncbi:MAG: GNAT family N-acetyltransferase [Cyanobacteria bacterium P01_A01_bin.135]